MNKILIMPDSYKGSLTAQKFCQITENVLKKYFTKADIKQFPIADGGEGTTDCFLNIDSFKKIHTKALNAFFEETDVYYAFDGYTRVIEMAMCASLPSAKGRENPATTTTYGVGQMLRHAVKIGAKQILIGLGGSCTNDAGVGMARGAGVCFFDKNNQNFIPTGESLDVIKDYDDTEFKNIFKDIKITAMCDIDNILYGENGAAYIFAPQKGADIEMVKMLDNKLKAVSDTVYNKTGMQYDKIKGSGAAGGMGFGVCAFLKGNLKSGTDAILDIINFEEELKDTDLILTGEGKLDSQSLSGKAVIGISRRAKKQNVPVIAITGAYTKDYRGAYDEGLTAVFSTNPCPQDITQAISNIENNLEATIENIAKILKIQKG